MSELDPIEYLLNAMENAGAQDDPSKHDYSGKRKKVLEAIRDLRSRVDSAEATLRDEFAAKAMQAVRWNWIDDAEPQEPDVYEQVSDHAYRMADAMLRARAKGKS